MNSIKIYQVSTAQHKQQVKELFWEYLQWANKNVQQEFSVSFNIEEMLVDDMETLSKFLPPDGLLLLIDVDESTAGLACMKKHTETICEIKRMYVRPDYRRLGLARKLLEKVIDEAQAIGYEIIRLDSAKFMKAAHALYRSMEFQEIEAYEGSEIPKDFQENWIFMERPI